MKNVKFASISDQLINTAIIMDMMFNTEMIVKDMKGGKEDMTEKRFVYYEHKGADYILDNPNMSLDFIEMLGDCLEAEEIVDLLNELNDENKELHKVIEENEKVIQSIYEELTKLRHIKENLRKIRNQWNWLIGSIDYD